MQNDLDFFYVFAVSGSGGIPYLKIVNLNQVTSVGKQNQGEKFAY